MPPPPPAASLPCYPTAPRPMCIPKFRNGITIQDLASVCGGWVVMDGGVSLGVAPTPVLVPLAMRDIPVELLFPGVEAEVRTATSAGIIVGTIGDTGLGTDTLLEEARELRPRLADVSVSHADVVRYAGVVLNLWERLMPKPAGGSGGVSEGCSKVDLSWFPDEGRMKGADMSKVGFAWTLALWGPEAHQGVEVVADLRFEALSAALACVCHGLFRVFDPSKWASLLSRATNVSFGDVWMDAMALTRCDALPGHVQLVELFKKDLALVVAASQGVQTLRSMSTPWCRKDLSPGSVKVLRTLLCASWWLHVGLVACVQPRDGVSLASALHPKWMARVVGTDSGGWDATRVTALKVAKCAHTAFVAAKEAEVLARFVARGEGFKPWVADLAHGIATWAKTTLVFAAAPLVLDPGFSLSAQHYAALCHCLCTLGCVCETLGDSLDPDQQTALKTFLASLDLWDPVALPATTPWHNSLAEAFDLAANTPAPVARNVLPGFVPGAVFSLPVEVGLPYVTLPDGLTRIPMQAAAEVLVVAVAAAVVPGLPSPPVWALERGTG